MYIRRIFIWFCALVLLLNSAAFAADAMMNIADDILSHASDGNKLQQWLDGPLTEGAGSSSDGYVIALRKLGSNVRYGKYLRAVSDKMESDAISSPVSLQRSALILIACGAEDRVPEELADETIGKLGVMSYAYGMHLLHNGAASQLWTAESVKDKLLSMQLEDGGWAVRGQYSDPDVTAMVLQALAGYPNREAALESAIERALDYLSDAQMENGGYSSYGIENSESAAQVIVALCSLGIDPHADVRFVKNSVSVMDALMAYRQSDGSFAHLPGEGGDDTATMQALQTLIAVMQPGAAFFDFSSLEVLADVPETNVPHGWKFYALIGIACFAVFGSIFALTRRRGRMKQLLFVLIVAALTAAGVLCVDVQSASSYYGMEQIDAGPVVGEVQISIRCDTVAGRGDAEIIPDDGVILERTSIPIHEGDSVFDVLTSAVRLHRIHMEYEGASEGFTYINGINYLYEYDYGELSGWMFSVNDEFPSVGCGSCAVADGDEIIWQYTTNIGEDL